MEGVLPAARVPRPLFRQICVLAACAGVWCSRDPSVGLAAAVLILIGCGRLPRARLGIFALCVAAGAGWSLLTRPAPPAPAPEWLEPGRKLRVTGVVAETTGRPNRRLRILLEQVRPDADEQAAPLPGRVAWTWDQGSAPGDPRPLPGQTVRLTAKIRPMTGFANEGTSDSQTYWAARGVYFNAWTHGDRGEVNVTGEAGRFAALRERWRAGMVDALGGARPLSRNGEPVHAPGMSQARAMLPALLFGDRYALDSSTLDMFTRAGLVHSLALSGQHLALAGTAAALLAWLLGRSRATLFLRVPRRTCIVALGLPLAALYLWVGDAPPSLLRAAAMLGGGALLWLGRRPCTLTDLLFFAALCFLVAWPQALFDLSVQLSMLSVAGIALALPVLRRIGHSRRVPGRALKGAAMLLVTSLAVQVATLPVMLITFGRANPLFPLNLLWLPALELLVLPAAALGLALQLVAGPQAASDALFLLGSLPGQALVDALEFLRERHLLVVAQGLKPAPLSALGYGAALIAAAALAGRRTSPAVRRLGLCAILLLPAGALERAWDGLTAARENRVALRVLDVGQGQALVVEWPDGRLLLDGGGSLSPRFDPGRDVVAHALTANRPPRLDLVLASHADLDHAGGLRAILETFTVRAFGRSALPFATASPADRSAAELEALRLRRRIPLRALRAGDAVDLGDGLVLEIVHPPEKGRWSSNNGSLAVRLIRNGHGLALLCGDAQIPALRRILQSGRNIRADVLVLPHHGSATSLLPEFYDAVSPRMALISCGTYNSFGFPRPEVLAALAHRGVPVLDTARHGEIRVTWTDAEACRTQSFRPPAP